MNAVTEAYVDNLRMMNGTSARVHHSGATFTSKIHALTDELGLPLKIVQTRGEAHDSQVAAALLADIAKGDTVLVGCTYDANWIHYLLNE